MESRRETRFKNIVHLWEFLLELLANENCRSIITWSNKSRWEFNIRDPNEVAKRWGQFKRIKMMTYDKLSRALRYYYTKGIISKVRLVAKNSTESWLYYGVPNGLISVKIIVVLYCYPPSCLPIFRSTTQKILNSMSSITDSECLVKKEQIMIIPIRRYFWMRNFVNQKKDALSLYRALEHLYNEDICNRQTLKEKKCEDNGPEVVIRIVFCFRRLWHIHSMISARTSRLEAKWKRLFCSLSDVNNYKRKFLKIYTLKFDEIW